MSTENPNISGPATEAKDGSVPTWQDAAWEFCDGTDGGRPKFAPSWTLAWAPGDPNEEYVHDLYEELPHIVAVVQEDGTLRYAVGSIPAYGMPWEFCWESEAATFDEAKQAALKFAVRAERDDEDDDEEVGS